MAKCKETASYGCRQNQQNAAKKILGISYDGDQPERGVSTTNNLMVVI